MQRHDLPVKVVHGLFVVLKFFILREHKKIGASVHSGQALDVLLSLNHTNSVDIASKFNVVDGRPFEDDKVGQLLREKLTFSFLGLVIGDSAFDSLEEIESRESGEDVDEQHRCDD